MPMLSKKKRRSVGHGFFSTISSPTTIVKIGGMEDPLPSVDAGGARAEDRHLASDEGLGHDAAGATPEPIVESLDMVHADEKHAPVHRYQYSSSSVGRTPDSQLQAQPLKSHPIMATYEDDAPAPTPAVAAAPPPDFNRIGIHIPTRTSNTATQKMHNRPLRSSSLPPSSPPLQSHSPAPMPATLDSSSLRERSLRERSLHSSSASQLSYATSTSSTETQNLRPLQARPYAEEIGGLSPLLEDDPQSYDLVASPDAAAKTYNLETRSQQLFSKEHLEAIFHDTASLLRFTTFLSNNRPKSVGVLIYYLDALKALRAVKYASAVAEALEPIDGHEFTEHAPRATVNAVLEDKAKQAFDILVRDELPAFITHVFIQHVSVSIQKRVTGNLPIMLRDASEGLAEVFCLTDPSRSDNPIIFASEEFHRTTQYGVSYAIGRNCRFLQGPMTSRATISRLSAAIKEGKEISEVFLNYRRDGSPFMNLLMMAPLLDSRGYIRYFIGSQVDVSGLVKECTGLDAFAHWVAVNEGYEDPDPPKDEFQELSEMFNNSELETVRKFGGNMHKERVEEDDGMSVRGGQGRGPRVLIKDMSNFEAATIPVRAEGRLQGVYKDYLLIRPAPSLRILFVSPSLRVPGILQSRFLDRIGGNTRVRNSVAEALSDSSRGVTAKIRWLTTATANLEEHQMEEGRPRWIHCTPLLNQTGAVGVWMVVLVDDEKQSAPARRFRQAPPIPSDLRKPPQRRYKPMSPEPSRSGLESDSEREGRSGRYPYAHTNGSVSSIPRHMGEMDTLRSASAASEQRANRRRSGDGVSVSVSVSENLRPLSACNDSGQTMSLQQGENKEEADMQPEKSRAVSISSVLTQDFATPAVTRRRTSSGARAGPFFSS